MTIHSRPRPFPSLGGHGRRRLGAACVVLMWVLAGCGNLTAGGIGEARVVVSGDAPDGEPQAASAPDTRQSDRTSAQPPSAAPAMQEEDDRPEGELEADFRLYLVAQDGRLVELGDDDIEVRVDLEGVETPEVASATLDVGIYTGLRMVFSSIEVEVDRGLVIGGIEITGRIEVDMDDLTLVVNRELTLAIREGQSAEVLVDLNAGQWLQAVDPITATVQAQVFADLVSVTVR